MTKSDLKILAQLPSLLAVLRKLSAEAQELQKLAASLTHPSSQHPSQPQSQLEPEPNAQFAPFLAAAQFAPNLETPERLEMREQALQRKAERAAFLAAARKSPQRAALAAQFKHDGGNDAEAPVTLQALSNLSGS